MIKETIKTFYLRYLALLAIPIALFFAFNRLNAFNQKQNFTIINERQSIIIQLPNTEYLEMTSKNDVITNYVDETIRPFSSITTIRKSIGLENSLSILDLNGEFVENGPNSRQLQTKQMSSNELALNLTATTPYRYTDGLVYNTQIDYTDKTSFSADGSTVRFTDKGCTVTIEGEGISYKIFDNQQSIILSKPYEPTVTFSLIISIRCTK